MRLFKVVTCERDADATDPEVFSGLATKPSLEKPIEARTSIFEVPDTGKAGEASVGSPGPAPEPKKDKEEPSLKNGTVEGGQVRFDDKAPN